MSITASAFPVPSLALAQGMTLRDYFAGQALAGWIAHHGSPRDDDQIHVHRDPFTEAVSDVVGVEVYRIADSMLKAREVQP